HRKLRDQNLTFRSLLQDVRQDLAGKYLADENYSITEIAFLLGYTDTGAFSRACRRWFNKSPTELRSSPSSS
ncbi:MAG TPA: helix-turn-helix transcriptional regulator, partial [Xanthomonadales bacterium]|nr:helix-turn-helix transcriptional regulator [Xanthomonadales bacterium]